MPEGMERIGVHLPSLLAYVVNFLVLLAVLYAVAYRPLLRIMRERSERIAKGLAEAEDARRMRAQVLEERAHALGTAREEAKRLEVEAQEAAAREIERARAAGREDAQAYLRRARDSIELERAQAFEEVARASADLVVLAAEKALGEAMDPQVQAKVTKTAIQEIARMRLPVLARRAPSVARVTSAVPLQPEELADLGTAVNALAGRPMRLVCRTEPRLLGGLTVAIGTSVVDASLLGRLEGLRRHLQP